MVSVQRQFPFVGLILLVVGQSAFSATYTDPSGFSFSYPDGWVPVTRATIGDVNQVVPHEMKAWISKNNVDLNRLTVVLVRNGRGEFLENLNVVVSAQQIPVNDETVTKLTGMLKQQYAAVGAKVDNVRGRIQKFGAGDAVVVDFQSRMPGVPITLQQRQVMFPGGGKTFIVTCTTGVDSFDLYRPTFDRVLASFQVPHDGRRGNRPAGSPDERPPHGDGARGEDQPRDRGEPVNRERLRDDRERDRDARPDSKRGGPAPVAQGFDWNEVLKMGAVGGVVGGLIGGLNWLMKKLSGKT